jgi:hypothetical protein
MYAVFHIQSNYAAPLYQPIAFGFTHTLSTAGGNNSFLCKNKRQPRTFRPWLPLVCSADFCHFPTVYFNASTDLPLQQ